MEHIRGGLGLVRTQTENPSTLNMASVVVLFKLVDSYYGFIIPTMYNSNAIMILFHDALRLFKQTLTILFVYVHKNTQ